ncbi:hypothetical protein FQA39_LY02637 [Lamprigera yunnana]|nr:hypothetical protein FQA39_LY02637 [Lamprigera yunnana]
MWILWANPYVWVNGSGRRSWVPVDSGVVHLWVNKSTGDYLAIKKCKWNLESHLTKKQQERWAQEVEIMRNIQNENIVGYREVPRELNKVLIDYSGLKLPILSMEYCSLGNLRSLLVQTQNCCGLEELDVKCILTDISAALIYLHGCNITHRDVKPENIVLQHCNHRRKPILYKLIDLGYAKELHNETASFVGTLQYLAPEIFAQRRYTNKVDYWSFGIMAFEIICGIRPFLHSFTPMESLPYIEKKESDVIALVLMHTGDIHSYTHLLNENHLNQCLAENLEKWLQTVFEYCPEKRGDFLPLQTILSKKIITIFSIFNYKSLSYEINEFTLLSTVQDWIARDTKVSVNDQYLVPIKNARSLYANDYYDECHSKAMLFVFKKNDSILFTSTALSSLIEVLFENVQTEFKFGTIKQLYTQTLYVVLNEYNQLEVLKSALRFQRIHLDDLLDEGIELYNYLSGTMKWFFSEVEFYNYIENSLFTKVDMNTNYINFKSCLRSYMEKIQQLVQISNIVNCISTRFNALIVRYDTVKNIYNVVFDLIEKCDFKILCMCHCWKEIIKLVNSLKSLELEFKKTKSELRNIQYQKEEDTSSVPEEMIDTTSKPLENCADILHYNMVMRYRFQELMDVGILQHKNLVNEIKKEMNKAL